MTDTSRETFTWLHITDLHVGMANQNWLWPTFKQALFDDLVKMFTVVGEIDLVIFSGDLTQSGSSDQFTKLDAILSELWKVLTNLGAKPALFVLPGNHDVQRAKKLTPELQVLRNWWGYTDIHEKFLRI
jgi:3',5'-cyclic AMP phosphodiesterase CpdA